MASILSASDCGTNSTPASIVWREESFSRGSLPMDPWILCDPFCMCWPWDWTAGLGFWRTLIAFPANRIDSAMCIGIYSGSISWKEFQKQIRFVTNLLQKERNHLIWTTKVLQTLKISALIFMQVIYKRQLANWYQNQDPCTREIWNPICQSVTSLVDKRANFSIVSAGKLCSESASSCLGQDKFIWT